MNGHIEGILASKCVRIGGGGAGRMNFELSENTAGSEKHALNRERALIGLPAKKTSEHPRSNKANLSEREKQKSYVVIERES